MLFCILSVCVLLLSSFCVTKVKNAYMIWGLFLCTIVICDLLSICGFFVPIHGYEEPIITEYELRPIVSDSNIYIIEQRDSSVLCRYLNEEENNEEIKEYINDFKIIGIDEGEKPVLRSSVTKAKKSIFTFALTEKEENIFYIPESNIECMR